MFSSQVLSFSFAKKKCKANMAGSDSFSNANMPRNFTTNPRKAKQHNAVFSSLLFSSPLPPCSDSACKSRQPNTKTPKKIIIPSFPRFLCQTSLHKKEAMMKPAGAGAVEIRVERPQPPPVHLNQARLRARPYYRRWTPWFVPAASVACVLVFLVTMFVNDCPDRSAGNCFASFLGRFSFQPLKENPLLGPSSTALLKMGALDVSKVVHGRQGWRLITCIWLHAGVVHLLINVLCLLFIGIRLEQEFGFVRIGIVYLISGFGGSLMSALFIRSSISVGASGALFGLIGSMLSELITNWSLYANKVAALLTLVFVIVVNLALGILPRVDNFAHIGGLISGFLLGFVVFIRPQFAWLNQKGVAPGQQTARSERKHKTYQYVLWIVGAVMLIVGFTVAIILLFRGYNANDHCSWCHYMSCVPTKKWKCNSSPTTCTAIMQGNTLNLTCESTGIHRSYIVAEAPQDKIDQLCNQLCS